LNGLGPCGSGQKFLKFRAVVIFELRFGHHASGLKENAAVLVFADYEALAWVAREDHPASVVSLNDGHRVSFSVIRPYPIFPKWDNIPETDPTYLLVEPRPRRGATRRDGS
jgi:hypothetical protein